MGGIRPRPFLRDAFVCRSHSGNKGEVCQEEHLKLRRVGLEQPSSPPNDGTNRKRAAAYHREDLRQAHDRRGECQVI